MPKTLAKAPLREGTSEIRTCLRRLIKIDGSGKDSGIKLVGLGFQKLKICNEKMVNHLKGTILRKMEKERMANSFLAIETKQLVASYREVITGERGSIGWVSVE